MSFNSNIGSTNISVFPVVNRDAAHSGDIYARHLSEEILAGIVNRLIDTDGFVITLRADFGESNPFAFNIHGYYFKIDKLSNLINLFDEEKIGRSYEYGDTIFAEISTVASGKWIEIYGQDETDDVEVDEDSYFYYSAVRFSFYELPTEGEIEYKKIDTDTTHSVYYIPLLKYVGTDSAYAWDDSGWCVPEANYVKFKKSSYVIERIDGGDYDSLN